MINKNLLIINELHFMLLINFIFRLTFIFLTWFIINFKTFIMLEQFEQFEIENQQVIYGGDTLDNDGIPPDGGLR